MSVRSASPRFVSVRGTMISTAKSNPSLLSTVAVQTLGMPNAKGELHIDDVQLHVTYVDDARISVWAEKAEPGGWLLDSCAVL